MPGSSSIVANASRPPTQPDNGSFAITVAVRGPSRSKAISPTIIPGCDSATVSCPSTPLCVTSARPDPMSKKETASSPCCMSTWPGAAVSGRSCAASGTRASVGQPANTSNAASSSARTSVRPDTSRGYGVAVTTSKEYAVSRGHGARGGPRISMPYDLAIAASAAGSGGTSSGGIVVVPVAGVPTARVNLSNPPGMCTVRNQARCRCSRTAIASLTLVFQDVQASGCVLPAGADAHQRALPVCPAQSLF